jgi:hypothetical protein
MLGKGAFFRNIYQQRKVPAFFEKPGVSQKVVGYDCFISALQLRIEYKKTTAA